MKKPAAAPPKPAATSTQKKQPLQKVHARAAATVEAVLPPSRAAAGLSGKINPKWAWHYRALLDLRESLLRERGEDRTGAAEPLEAHGMHMADSGSDEFDHDLSLSKLAAKQDKLFEVDEALQRIATGTYGVCQESGKPISAARLKAIPWTAFSKEVETRLERDGSVHRQQLASLGSVRSAALPELKPGTKEDEDAPAEKPTDKRLRPVRLPAKETARKTGQMKNRRGKSD